MGEGLDRVITKYHDERVLAETFKLLDIARSVSEPNSTRGPAETLGGGHEHRDG